MVKLGPISLKPAQRFSSVWRCRKSLPLGIVLSPIGRVITGRSHHRLTPCRASELTALPCPIIARSGAPQHASAVWTPFPCSHRPSWPLPDELTKPPSEPPRAVVSPPADPHHCDRCLTPRKCAAPVASKPPDTVVRRAVNPAPPRDSPPIGLTCRLPRDSPPCHRPWNPLLPCMPATPASAPGSAASTEPS